MENRVALDKCAGYAAGDIENIILSQFSRLGLGEDFFSGKKVLLKPNLVFAVTPEGCATTHPAVTEAAARAVKKLGGIPLIAESPGGPYSAASTASPAPKRPPPAPERS